MSGTGEFDGQKAASHKSARAPRIVPRDLGGGREDGSWIVDSDDDDDDDVDFVLFFTAGCLLKGIPVLDGLERERQTSGSEPDKGIIEPWRLG